MSAISQVIAISVNDDGTSQDAQLSAQRNLLVSQIDLCDSGVISDDIAQITGVTDLMSGSTVFLAMRIEVRSSRHASVCVVAELVNVESVQAGLQAGNFSSHLNRIRLALKNKFD